MHAFKHTVFANSGDELTMVTRLLVNLEATYSRTYVQADVGDSQTEELAHTQMHVLYAHCVGCLKIDVAKLEAGVNVTHSYPQLMNAVVLHVAWHTAAQANCYNGWAISLTLPGALVIASGCLAVTT